MYSFVKQKRNRKESEEMGKALGDVGVETPPIIEPTAVVEGNPLETGGFKPIPGTTTFQDGVATPPGQNMSTISMPVPYVDPNTGSKPIPPPRKRKPRRKPEQTEEAESWTDSITNWIKENWLIVVAIVGVGGVAVYFATKK